MDTKIIKEEYGGYLPFESCLMHGKILLGGGGNVIPFNTAKAAIPVIKKYIRRNKIYCPYYLCQNVICELKKNFEIVSFYHISKDLLPCENIFDDNSAVVYLVNYFGIMGDKIRKMISQQRKTVFILDNAHAFFAKPILREGVYNIYACKKFFGVPDGAYLISKENLPYDYEPSVSWNYANYLIKSFECGTNTAYGNKKEIDLYLNEHPAGMSIFSKYLLNCIDYPSVRKIRKRNFICYQKFFKNVNLIKCEEKSIPYLYPLNVGKNIKKELVQKRIYIPTLWTMPYKTGIDEYEDFLADNTLFLPLDQRYSVMDINYIIKAVNDILEATDE